MIVLVLIVAAAVLLALGIGVDSTMLDATALGLASFGVLIVLVTWIAPLIKRREAAEARIEKSPEPRLKPAEKSVVGGTPPANIEAVVFVAGRTTFHLDGCALVSGKITGKAHRGDLESGGMAACKRCIKT